MAIDAAIVSAGPGETRIALLDAERVVEFVIDRGDPAPGDVVEGRVVEVVPGLGAAFVDFGAAQPGFINSPKGVGVGSRVVAEVTVAARPGKGAELRLAAGAPEIGRRGPLKRVLADYPDIRLVTVDDRATWAEIRSVRADAVHDPRCWADSGAADALDEALAPRLALPGGASLDFAETKAATVIDIDGGGLAPIAANVAALPEVARQLRLRSIAGHVLVDVIPTRDGREAAKLVEMLKAAVAGDPARVQVAGRTPLGMIELTRRRRGPSLAETMLEPATAAPNALTQALDAVRALLREADAQPAAAPRLVLPPAAATALLARPGVMAEVARRLGRAPELVEAAR
jgi:Ribonuclease G/E